jgi:hypothetical protein
MIVPPKIFIQFYDPLGNELDEFTCSVYRLTDDDAEYDLLDPQRRTTVAPDTTKQDCLHCVDGDCVLGCCPDGKCTRCDVDRQS